MTRRPGTRPEGKRQAVKPGRASARNPPRPNPFPRNSLADRLLEALPVSAWLKSTEGILLACNSRCAADFGRKKSELINRLSPEFTSPDLRERAVRSDAELVKDRNAVVYEARQLREDGTYRYGIVTKSPIFNPDGSVVGIFGVVTDITERKQAEEELQLAAEVFEHSDEAIYIADENNHILKVNPAFTNITGYAFVEVQGTDPRVLGPTEEQSETWEAVWSAVSSRGIWHGEFTNRRKSGELFPVWATIIALGERQGRRAHYLGIFRDITERKASEDRMRWLAHHDFLTGLASRGLYEDRLDQALRRARRDRTTLALFIIDLNGFKAVNDSLGHLFGDQILKGTASRLLECVRQTDTVARIGGDEYAVVAPDIGTRANVEALARKIVSAVCQPMEHDTGEMWVGASVGASLFPDHGDSGQILQALADAAMYRIKKSGRSGYSVHEH
jgi:diguanylate cyclase (GGDEF)-like protein/PAS domain S-box-containing protein